MKKEESTQALLKSPGKDLPALILSLLVRVAKGQGDRTTLIDELCSWS